MLAQVVIRAVCNAPELAPAEGEEEFEVRRGLGVEAELLRVMVSQAQVFLLHTAAPVSQSRQKARQ